LALERADLPSFETAKDIEKMLSLAGAFKTFDYPSGQLMALAATVGLFPESTEIMRCQELLQEVFARTGNKFLQLITFNGFFSMQILFPGQLGKSNRRLAQIP
jgi:hypothetical protein